MKIEAEYEVINKKLICTNVRQVLKHIKTALPGETYVSIATRSRVHPQTVQRWLSVGRADAKAIQLLISSFKNDEILNENILLKEATPSQLKRRCIEIGWDKVINALHLWR